jgi:hypothetical protein
MNKAKQTSRKRLMQYELDRIGSTQVANIDTLLGYQFELRFTHTATLMWLPDIGMRNAPRNTTWKLIILPFLVFRVVFPPIDLRYLCTSFAILLNFSKQIVGKSRSTSFNQIYK